MQLTVFPQNIHHCWIMHFLSIWSKSFINYKVLSVSEQTKLKKAFTKTFWRAEEKKLQSTSEIKQKQNSHLFWFTMCFIFRFDSGFSISLSKCALRWSSQKTYGEKTSMHFSIESGCYSRSVPKSQIETKLCFQKKSSL